MPAPSQVVMKQNIKTALLSKADPVNTGHPLYCKKTIDSNGDIVFYDTELMPAMDDMIGYIAQGITTTWSAWQLNQTVTGTAAITAVTVATATSGGVGVGIINGNLP